MWIPHWRHKSVFRGKDREITSHNQTHHPKEIISRRIGECDFHIKVAIAVYVAVAYVNPVISVRVLRLFHNNSVDYS